MRDRVWLIRSSDASEYWIIHNNQFGLRFSKLSYIIFFVSSSLKMVNGRVDIMQSDFEATSLLMYSALTGCIMRFLYGKFLILLIKSVFISNACIWLLGKSSHNLFVNPHSHDPSSVMVRVSLVLNFIWIRLIVSSIVYSENGAIAPTWVYFLAASRRNMRCNCNEN